MAYDVKLLNQVNEIFRQRRETAQTDLLARRAEAYKKDPRIREVDAGIHARYRELIQGAFSGKSPTKAEIRAVSVDFRVARGELLVQSAFPADYLELKYKCKKCADEGYVNGQMCVCFRKELNRAAAAQTKLSRLVDEQTFKTFKLDCYPDEGPADRNPRKIMERVYEHCKRYAEEFSPASGNLFFTGPTGLGKTFLSSAIAREIIEKGYSVVYDSIANIVGDYENIKFGKGGSEEGLRKYDDCDLLIIDDLGTELITQYSESVLYTLINNRINLKKPMIISSNLDADSLGRFYSQSILSRLSGEFLTMPFTGEDIRQKRRAAKK